MKQPASYHIPSIPNTYGSPEAYKTAYENTLKNFQSALNGWLNTVEGLRKRRGKYGYEDFLELVKNMNADAVYLGNISTAPDGKDPVDYFVGTMQYLKDKGRDLSEYLELGNELRLLRQSEPLQRLLRSPPSAQRIGTGRHSDPQNLPRGQDRRLRGLDRHPGRGGRAEPRRLQSLVVRLPEQEFLRRGHHASVFANKGLDRRRSAVDPRQNDGGHAVDAAPGVQTVAQFLPGQGDLVDRVGLRYRWSGRSQLSCHRHSVHDHRDELSSNSPLHK